MKKRFFNLVLALIAVFVVASCSKKDDPIPEPPVTPFKVVSISPANGATGVNQTVKIEVTLSKKLKAEPFTGMNFTVGTNAATNKDVTFSMAYDGDKKITYSSSGPVGKNIKFTVQISDYEPLYASDGTKLDKFVSTFTTGE